MYSPVFIGSLEKRISRTLTYDTDYLLTDIVDTDGSSTSPLDWYYAYDANANIELIRDDLDSSNTQDFFYDKLNRLETAAGSYGDITYSYDNVGNRLTKLHTDGGVTRKETYTYSYQTGMPDSHQLEKVAIDLTNDGVDDESRNFAYDDNGNLVVDDQATNLDFDLTYNSHQRYEQLDIGGAPTTYYQHNSLGQRVQKTTMQTIHYHYDESGRLIGETDQLGNTKEYIYADDMRIARYDNATVYYFHNDHLGRPIALTDQGKAVVWQAEYLPFGKVYTLVNNTVDNELGFPGQILDQESGFYYNYFRDYDPSAGRYIQSDPIGLKGGLNTYLYVGANPLIYFDSLGLQALGFRPPPRNPFGLPSSVRKDRIFQNLSEPNVVCIGGGCFPILLPREPRCAVICPDDAPNECKIPPQAQTGFRSIATLSNNCQLVCEQGPQLRP